MPGEPVRPPVFIAERSSLELDTVLLDGPEGRHAATVRRLRQGERVDLTDGDGMTAECVVAASRPGSLELSVRSRRIQPAPQPRLCVVQAIPKGDRGEQAVETMTEVGVDLIVPWAAQRCVAVWAAGGPGRSGPPLRTEAAAHADKTPTRADKALARWRGAARQAAKQARRSRIPEVTALASTAGVAVLLRRAARGIVLDPDAGLHLGEMDPPASGEIVLVVGPEGGLSPAEAAAFAEARAVPARLGPTVLRSSTAGTAAAAVLLSLCGRW